MTPTRRCVYFSDQHGIRRCSRPATHWRVADGPDEAFVDSRKPPLEFACTYHVRVSRENAYCSRACRAQDKETIGCFEWHSLSSRGRTPLRGYQWKSRRYYGDDFWHDLLEPNRELIKEFEREDHERATKEART